MWSTVKCLKVPIVSLGAIKSGRAKSRLSVFQMLTAAIQLSRYICIWCFDLAFIAWDIGLLGDVIMHVVIHRFSTVCQQTVEPNIMKVWKRYSLARVQ